MSLLGTLLSVLLSAAPTAPPANVRPSGNQPPTARVAVCQILSLDGDPEGNFRRIEYALEDAAKDRADLAVFPETIIHGWVNPQAHDLADPIPGPTSDRLAALARRHEMMIAAGLAEKAGTLLYDSAVLMDRDGSILLKHRKINTIGNAMHPPYSRGRIEDVKVADTRLGRIGIIICADMFKKEIVAAVGRQRPDLLLLPNGTAIRPKHWPGHGENLRKLVCDVAQRIGCPVVAPNLVGSISHGRLAGWTYGGLSPVTDARGEILAILRDRDVEVRVVEVPLSRRDNAQ